MATLMTVFGPDGEVAGRCDERCYDAHELTCRCICNGRNHGSGLKRAVATTVERGAAMIEHYAERTYLDRGEYTATVFEDDVKQKTLF